MNKSVFVVTKSELFTAEEFLFVASSKKTAEKELRKRYPYMKPDGEDAYVHGRNLLFIRQQDVI